MSCLGTSPSNFTGELRILLHLPGTMTLVSLDNPVDPCSSNDLKTKWIKSQTDREKRDLAGAVRHVSVCQGDTHRKNNQVFKSLSSYGS